ncbi:conserved hypothetical protein [Leishmania infantum JPCM5]|uniref:Uncharacterized protein n=2 Tax=Leishmania infantum TaxID=5671 RepID=A4HTH6_LEIIN|nr:conserved hypothetical protein [Leishmania infantum JPCM5]CAC9450715.1 hypothetical_protein_-_conserved [Leishmania infantum]CAM65725.1 conserved hypothetical protein [Leishmania infantum JPCM5]SUZ39341.1 hypothetical_protein_-_conserved [Leishmania infantum]|eukprot:XP_001463367.1 conserved hypothetical protein [Leishmania infantum JPCM5]
MDQQAVNTAQRGPNPHHVKRRLPPPTTPPSPASIVATHEQSSHGGDGEAATAVPNPRRHRRHRRVMRLYILVVRHLHPQHSSCNAAQLPADVGQGLSRVPGDAQGRRAQLGRRYPLP